jgi:hypothetical protein
MNDILIRKTQWSFHTRNEVWVFYEITEVIITINLIIQQFVMQ